MSQNATLYRIDKNDFSKLVDGPKPIDLTAIIKGRETFQQTHEGFRFILSKGRDEATAELVGNIFYPAECIGEVPDLENMDWDNLPPDASFGEDLIYYNKPATVAAIASFLTGISAETITAQYDADELNESSIYPGVWNNESFEEHGFNRGHLIHELEALKIIYARAAAEGDYILSFVG